MKLSLRTAFLQAKSALAFDAWFFYYTRSTSKTRLHQMALSAWKATAQQSISNSAIQSSVKGMQKKKKGGERKKGHEKAVRFLYGLMKPAPLLLPLIPFSSPSSQTTIFSLSCNILGGFQSDCTWKLVTKQHIHTFHPHEGSFKFWYTRGLMID